MQQSINNITSPKCSISLKDQIKIARDHKKIKCLATLAEKYNYSISQVQSIFNKKDNPKSALKTNRTMVSLLEKVVYEWFHRAQRLVETGPITNEMLLQKALESKEVLGMQHFQLNIDWVERFKKKFNITELDMTLLRLENDGRRFSADINDIVSSLLGKNRKERLLKKKPENDRIPNPQAESDNDILNGTEMIIPDDIVKHDEERTKMEQEQVITICDDQPKRHFKPLEEYNGTENLLIPDDNIVKQMKETKEVVPVAITNNNQARLHLKPLEDYVLLSENYRAIGLISQLEQIFAAESRTNK